MGKNEKIKTLNMNKITTIEEALDDFRQGKFVIVVDGEDRENHCYLPTGELRMGLLQDAEYWGRVCGDWEDVF